MLSDLAMSVEQMKNFINGDQFSRSKFLLYAHHVRKALCDKQINYTKIKNQAFLIDIMFREVYWIDIFRHENNS